MSEFERKPDGGLSAWIETYEAMGGGENDAEMLCLLLELRRRRENQAEEERERDELRAELAEHDEQIARMEGKFSLAKRALDSKTARCDKAEAELRRRDAGAGELPSDELSRLREWVKCVEAERDKAISWHSSLLKKHDKLQADIERRDGAAGEPVAWQYRYNDGKVGDWKTVDSESECNHSPCYERRAIYSAAPHAVLQPPLDNWHNSASGVMESLQFKGDEISFTTGANWMREQCLALGAQQQKVVELHKRKSTEVISGQRYSYVLLEDLLPELDAANVKWEVKA